LIVGQCGAQVGRHERGQIVRRAASDIVRGARDEPEQHATLDDEHRGEERDEPERHSPIQAPKPHMVRHR
jgi:hypothetical protein